ncbi:MAG: cation:proton antiporter [Alphaproteobacteria bacterium]|nr:cation:proton antiporter [Alphaproteobacteria bacterium]
MEFLAVLLILLIATRFCGEIATRLGQPVMVGELLAGVAIGALAQQFTAAVPALLIGAHDNSLRHVIDLAICFLMLLAGIEMRPREIADASGTSLAVALGGVAVPMALGVALGWLSLPESPVKLVQCLFLGTALSITAVPVAIKILMDLGALHTRTGEVIVSAAIFDDIFGLALLATLTAFMRTGELPGVDGLVLLGANVLLFFAVVTVMGLYVFPWAGRVSKRLQEPEGALGLLLIAALSYAVLAELLGMHFILGAFAAGLFFGRHTVDPDTYDSVRLKVSGITSGFMAPIFFASIGLRVDLSAAIHVPVFTAVLIGAAMLGKLVGAGLPAFWCGLKPREAACVGAGMSVRGAVELIVADVALEAGLFALPDPPPPVVAHLFSAVVLMAMVTTIVAPMFLRWGMRGVARSPQGP